MNIRTVIFVIIVVMGLSVSRAETQSDSTTTSPCDIPEMRQFDFWLGEWDLTWGEDGHGTNAITADYDGCVVMERFDGAPSMNFRGMSVSTYNQVTGKWHQTWVDNSGGYLDFVGGMDGDRMILSREATRDGETFLQRMVFYSIEKDSLDWNWERSDDDGATWQLKWKIHYRRK